MIRYVGATFTGIVIAFMVVALVEALGHQVFPPPENFDLNDPAAMARLIQSLPLGALVFVVAGWALGALAGGYVSKKVARGRTRIPSLLVSVAMLAATGWSLYAIPHPLWMAVAGIVLPLPMVLAGAALAGDPSDEQDGV